MPGHASDLARGEVLGTGSSCACRRAFNRFETDVRLSPLPDSPRAGPLAAPRLDQEPLAPRQPVPDPFLDVGLDVTIRQIARDRHRFRFITR